MRGIAKEPISNFIGANMINNVICNPEKNTQMHRETDIGEEKGHKTGQKTLLLLCTDSLADNMQDDHKEHSFTIYYR